MDRAERATATLVERLHQVGVVPVVELPSAEDAVPLAAALIEGGLSCVEITLRTEGAVEPGAEGALGRWTVENCGGGGPAFVGGAPSLPAPGGVDAGGVEAGSCDPCRSSISAIAASSARSSRVMSLSGSGGRRLLSCSRSAFRARP